MHQHGANQRTAFGIDADGKLAGYFSLPPLGELAFYNPQLHSWIAHCLKERRAIVRFNDHCRPQGMASPRLIERASPSPNRR
jgi:hypothetical protein